MTVGELAQGELNLFDDSYIIEEKVILGDVVTWRPVFDHVGRRGNVLPTDYFDREVDHVVCDGVFGWVFKIRLKPLA